MNCPKCQKKLPKGNPRICPNCKKDLGNYYKLLAKQNGGSLPQENTEPANKLPRILLIAALACVLIAGAVLLILHLNGSKTPQENPTDAPVPTAEAGKETAAPVPDGETAPASGNETAEPFDMAAVKAEINSMQISDFEPSSEMTDYVKITVKDFGEIVVRLRPDVAPISVQNFKDLVARSYYDGTTFHRVYPGFMIQGGAGEEELTPIKGEFASNGIENPLLHIRGVISMARTTVKDSATSQFFLMHADSASLDGSYAAFGYIVAGLRTVDDICDIDLGYNPYNGEQSVPLEEVLIESVVFVKPV